MSKPRLCLTLAPDVNGAIRERAKKNGFAVSQIVEAALRSVFALPAPDPLNDATPPAA